MVLIASNNEHKIQEIQAIMPTTSFISPKVVPTCTPKETGSSFAENALIKAIQFYKVSQQHAKTIGTPITAVLAEDSGLCVASLNGRPGIYSARYAFTNNLHKQQQETDPLYQCKALLQEMEGMTDRYAYFICHAVLYYAPHQYVSSQAIWEGEIVPNTPSGSHGFGYDPIFFLPKYQCTSAMLETEQKNRLSHRAKALQALKHML